MNTVIALITAFFVIPAHAESSELNFEPCTRVVSLAVLNKDNYPYWVQSPIQQTDVVICYNSVKTFVSQATDGEIAELETFFEGRIRVFSEDSDFKRFLDSQPEFQNGAVGQSITFQSQVKTINPYIQPVLFTGLIQTP